MVNRDGVRSWKRSVRLIVIFAAAGYLGLLAISRSAAADSGKCAAVPASQALNYWLGDWTVTTPEEPGSSTSKVSLLLDKCVVVENWKDGTGHSGENIFAYNLGEKSWRGMFVNDHGQAHVFVDGKVAAGTAEFDGPSRGPKGEMILNRIRLVRKTPNKVEQTWEQSTDNGNTWTMVFRGEYSRQKL
jgi:hypothetical protein